MTDIERAQQLAQAWIAAWNAHELPAILALYTEDFRMSSPYIVQLMQDPGGSLSGREAVGAYWARALEKFPDLHFELKAVYAGVDSVVVVYHSNRSGEAAEIFFLAEDGLIRSAAAHYG